jgi:hypothetical protein
MSADPATWRLIYFDDQALLYVRADQVAERAMTRRYGFRWLDPARLASLPDVRDQALVAADAEFARQTERCADCYRTRLAAAALALAHRDDAQFQLVLDALLAQGSSPETTLLMARSAEAQGDLERARQLYRQFETLGGDPVLSALLEARMLRRAGQLEAAGEVLDRASRLPGAQATIERARAALHLPDESPPAD